MNSLIQNNILNVIPTKQPIERGIDDPVGDYGNRTRESEDGRSFSSLSIELQGYGKIGEDSAPSYENLLHASYIHDRIEKGYSELGMSAADHSDLKVRPQEAYTWSSEVLSNAQNTTGLENLIVQAKKGISNVHAYLPSLAFDPQRWPEEAATLETEAAIIGSALSYTFPITRPLGLIGTAARGAIGALAGGAAGGITGGVKGTLHYERTQRRKRELGGETTSFVEAVVGDIISSATGGAVSGAIGGLAIGGFFKNATREQKQYALDLVSKNEIEAMKRSSTGVTLQKEADAYIREIIVPDAPQILELIKELPTEISNAPPIIPIQDIVPIEEVPIAPVDIHLMTPGAPVEEAPAEELPVAPASVPIEEVQKVPSFDDESKNTIDLITKAYSHYNFAVENIDNIINNNIDSIRYLEKSADETNIYPVLALKRANNSLRNIKKTIIYFDEQFKAISTESFKDLSFERANDLKNKLFTTIKELNNLNEHDVNGIGIDKDIRDKLLNYYNNSLKEITKAALEIRLRETTAERGAPSISTKQQILDLTTHSLSKYVSENNVFDMKSMSNCFLVEGDESPRFNKNWELFPLQSEEEIAQVFNKVMIDHFKSLPYKKSVEWLYGHITRYTNTIEQYRSFYFNTMLNGIKVNDIELFNKMRSDIRINKILYDTVRFGKSDIGNLDGKIYNIVTQIGKNIRLANQDSIENLRRLGIAMPALSGNEGYISQTHDASLMLAAGEDKWIETISDLLDWNAMRVSERVRDQSDLIANTKDATFFRKKILKTAWHNIINTNDGKYMIPTIGRSMTSLHNERVLIFKGYNEWSSYQKEFGRDEAVITILGDHFRASARQQACIELFGHNPNSLISELKSEIEKGKIGLEEDIFHTTSKKIARILNGVDSLFTISDSTGDPIFVEKLLNSLNEIAVPFMTKNIIKYSLFHEPIQAGQISHIIGSETGGPVSEGITYIKNIVDAFGDFLKVYKISDISKWIYKKGIRLFLKEDMGMTQQQVEEYSSAMMIHDIEQALSIRANNDNRRDIWPWALKTGQKATSLFGGPQMLERSRKRIRIHAQRSLHLSLSSPWENITDGLIGYLIESGITKKEWEQYGLEVHKLGTITKYVQPEFFGESFDVQMFSPMEAYRQLNNLASFEKKDLHTFNQKISFAQRLENAVINIINEASLQSDSFITDMAYGKIKQPIGKTIRSVMGTQAQKAQRSFMGYSSNFIHTFFLKKNQGGINRNLKGAITGIVLGSFLAICMMQLIQGKNPIANEKTLTTTIARTASMALGINWVGSVIQNTLGESNNTSIQLARAATGLSKTLGAGATPGISFAAGLVARGVELGLASYSGNVARQMHAIRKAIPLNHWFVTDFVINRIILDNLFYAINSDAAIDEFQIQSEEAQRRGEEYVTGAKPGELISGRGKIGVTEE